MVKLKEKRETLERKILAIFHAVHDMPEACEKGIGKYSIKRTLEHHDETLKVSINTVKRIVDKMLEDGVIECVNPELKCGLRFRLLRYICCKCGGNVPPVIGTYGMYCGKCGGKLCVCMDTAS